MIFKIYKPTDIVIIWAIKNAPDFAVELDAFKKLPQSTPVKSRSGFEKTFFNLYVEKNGLHFKSNGHVFPTGNELLALIDEFIQDKGYQPKGLTVKFTSEVEEINADKVIQYKDYVECERLEEEAEREGQQYGELMDLADEELRNMRNETNGFSDWNMDR